MWKGMLEARKSNEKEICLEIYKDEMRAVKRCKYHSKKKTNEEFVRKMNQNANGNRKIFLKEEGKANGRKLENFSRIKKKNRIGRVVVGVERLGRNILRIFITLLQQGNRQDVIVKSYAGILVDIV